MISHQQNISFPLFGWIGTKNEQTTATAAAEIQEKGENKRRRKERKQVLSAKRGISAVGERMDVCTTGQVAMWYK
jgi:hypothetical protein